MCEEDSGEVTDWFRRLERDDSESAELLWNWFFGRLLEKAESLLHQKKQHRLDGEDIASEVMTSLWNGARQGRFANIKNRDELWWLLLAITRMTMVDKIRHEMAQKRGGDVTVLAIDERESAHTFGQLVSREPTPEVTIAFAEEVSRLLSLLRDDTCRQIAVLWLEGCPQHEIAEKACVSTATVTRKLLLIRQIWQAELDP